MAPNAPHTRECDATYPCSHSTYDINLSHRHSQFKKIGVELPNKIKEIHTSRKYPIFFHDIWRFGP